MQTSSITKSELTQKFFETKDKNTINEEELFHGIIGYELHEKFGAKISDQFIAHVYALRSKASPKVQLEDICRQALDKMVAARSLTSTDRARIEAVAFSAAQLDTNLAALYDSTGSKHDNTIAIAPCKEAIANALIKRTRPDTTTLQFQPKKEIVQKGTQLDGSGGLLIKPKTNNEGTLAVLIDRENIPSNAKVVIKDSDGTILDTGTFTSFGEDGKRAKFAFKKPGSAYPKNASIEVLAAQGSTLKLDSLDLSKRYD